MSSSVFKKLISLSKYKQMHIQEIVFSNGKRGVFLHKCGTFLTFQRVDKNGNEIFERTHVRNFKQKVFTISTKSLNQLIENGDVKHEH